MCEVVGLKNVVSKKDGTHYVELHLISDDRFVIGKRCEAVFVREDMISNIESLSPGSVVTVAYNRFGRVDSVSVL